MSRNLKKATETSTDTGATTASSAPTGDFRIASDALTDTLARMMTVADRKSAMPILGRVCIRAEAGGRGVTIAATDLNVSLTVRLSSASWVTNPGGMTLDTKRLHDLAKSLPEGDVGFSRADANWAKIQSGRVTARLDSIPDRDFPKIPDATVDTLVWVTADARTLVEMIDRTAFSVCKDETRFHLNGALLECDGTTARMVTTDGHRLTKTDKPWTGPVLTSGVIIPQKGLSELKRLLGRAGGNVQIALSKERHILFAKHGNAVLSVKLIDAQFPPYEQVIPKLNQRVVTVDREALIAAFKRSTLLSSDTRGVLIKSTSGTLTVISDNPDAGDLREEIDADHSGLDAKVGFNAKYVLETLKQLSGDRVTIALSEELTPGLFTDPADRSFVSVIMPMRI